MRPPSPDRRPAPAGQAALSGELMFTAVSNNCSGCIVLGAFERGGLKKQDRRDIH